MAGHESQSFRALVLGLRPVPRPVPVGATAPSLWRAAHQSSRTKRARHFQ